MKTKMRKRLAAIAVAACSVWTTCASPVSATYNSSTVTQQEVFSTAYQTYYMACAKNKFPAGKYWNHNNYRNLDTYSDIPCKRDPNNAPYHDACNSIYNGEVVGPGLQKLPADEVESYAWQCAGFARKLAKDFTGGGRVFVRMGMDKNFRLRVGDQLRIRCYGANNSYSDHSIFVTEVSGSSFKFADCNWTGDCKIRWDVQGIIHNGSLIIGNKFYPTLYVERPLMAGDVNADCVVDGTDLSIIRQISNGTYKFNGSYEKYVRQVADVNNDNTVNAKDVFYFQQGLTGNPNMKMRFLTHIMD